MRRVCSKPFSILVVLHWTCSSKSVSLLYQRVQHWTWPSSCASGGEQRRTTTCFNLLATVMRPTVLVACFALRESFLSILSILLAFCQLLAHQNPKCFSTQLLSRWLTPACTDAWRGVISPQGQDLSLLFFVEVPIDLFLQSLEVPLNGCAPMWCINHSSQFSII